MAVRGAAASRPASEMAAPRPCAGSSSLLGTDAYVPLPLRRAAMNVEKCCRKDMLPCLLWLALSSSANRCSPSEAMLNLSVKPLQALIVPWSVTESGSCSLLGVLEDGF